MSTAIQIGTNTGADTFFDICKTEKYDMIYLIEPQARYNNAIQLKYDGFIYKIFNIAITSQKIDQCKLYEMGLDGTHYSLSKRKSHPDSKVGGLPFQTVPCMTFNAFCGKNDLQSIDLLYIDTEGLDDEILMSIDFNKIGVKKIIWELWDHNDDDECNIYNTGWHIQLEVRSKLLNMGYEIKFVDCVNLCAVKQEAR